MIEGDLMSVMEEKKNCNNMEETIMENENLNEKSECDLSENADIKSKENLSESSSETEEQKVENKDKGDGEIQMLKNKLREKEKECEEYVDLLRRSRAEFDNYRKRTNKEKETMYDDGFADAVKQMLPTLDNLERAVESIKDEDKDSFYEGVEMVLKALKDCLEKSGVGEIKALGESFDPDFHNAVMHVDDENYGTNTVVEVFQKGYLYKNKVIRYSMVKVAN